IAAGTITPPGLSIEACRRADQLPGAGGERGACFRALRRMVAREADGVFGFDFPFGLPRALSPIRIEPTGETKYSIWQKQVEGRF
ncbi:MAG: hypothetical protein V2A79_20280, partial [Planctomycetota bacterium]